MADTTSNPWVLPGDLSYASIDTALTASDVAYGVTGNSIADSTSYENLIGAGWTQILIPTQYADVGADHYQGVAFYKVVNGVTEVIIANRGSWPGGDGPSYLYDYTTSDAELARGANPACNADALTYYEQISNWVQQNLSGPVNIVETGHSLGGEEADFVQATIAENPAPYTYGADTETVTFDAPGLPSLFNGINQQSVDALNISLSTDPIHADGAAFNAGFGGQSVTVNGGISGLELYGIAGPLGYVVGELAYDHSISRILSYLNVSPALGGVNLATYQPDQITQAEVGQMADLSAAQYDWMTPSELAQYYQSVLGGQSSGGAPGSTSNGTAQETFTASATDTGEVLTGSEGDTITIATASGSGAGATVTVTDNSGDQATITYSSDGTYIASDTWSNAQGMQGTDSYAADGSASGKVVYASGGYATYFADGEGNITWDYYNSEGNLFSWSWVHSDGSSGTGAVMSNGLTLIPDSSSSYDVPPSYFEVDQNSDGSYVEYTGTVGNQETTSQFNSSGSLTSTSTVQGAGENYDLSDTTTQTSTDGSGDVVTSVYDSAGDLVSENVQYASGASKQITYNASGATTAKDVNADGSSDIIYTDGGDRTENFYNASGALTGDTWSLSDGTTGQDAFNADGSGSGTITYANGATSTLTVDSSLDITITNDNASGQKVSEDWWQANGTHGIIVYDPDGSSTTYSYEQNGNVVETEYGADQSVALQETLPAGGMVSPDGSEFGAITNADGSSSIDYVNSNGDAIVFNVTAEGQLSSVDHASAQPTSEFSISLEGGQTVESPYNGNTDVFTGPDGTQYVEYMNSAGVATGEDWTTPGGGYGYVTFNADGSSSAITYNPDGTYYTTATDSAGDTTTSYYDSTGTLTSDSWTDADGAYGGDQYNPDGSSSGTYVNADGSYSYYTDDGQGNITEWDYSSAGSLVSSEWQAADGSYGSEVVNDDGSIDGSQYQADGSYQTFTIDPQGDDLTEYYSDTDQLTSQVWSFTDGNGNTITYDFDGSGNLLQESWASADGATETVSGATGSNLLSSLNGDRVDGELITGAAAGGTMQALGNEDTVSAVGGQNVMYALGTADYLEGASGSDTLIALGAGATLVGGTGNEVFEVNDPTDVVEAQANAASNQLYSSVSYTLPLNVDVLTLTGTGDVNAFGNSDAADLITGNSGNDLLAAGSGDDTLIAGSGSDTLVGGMGVDTFEAGTGDDTFVINNIDDVIDLGNAPGDDTVESSVSYTLGQGLDTLLLTGSADLEGQGNADASNELQANSGNDTLTAGSGSDSLFGGPGNDMLIGGSGDDLLVGGAGSDTFVAGLGIDTLLAGSGDNTFIINSAQDLIQVNGPSGSNTVESSVSYVLGQGLDTLELTGSSNLKGQGNAGASNELQANSGNDTLIAGSGSDTLIGGSGNDTLVAGSGNDTLIAGSGTDLLEGGAGNTTYVLDSGFGQAEIEPGSESGVIQFGDGIAPSDLTVGLTTDSNGNLALLIEDGSSVVTVEGGLGGSIGSFEFANGTQLSLASLLAAATVTPDSIAGSSGNEVLNTSAGTSLTGGTGEDTIVGTGASDTLMGSGPGSQFLMGIGSGDSLVGGYGDDTLVGSGDSDTLVAGAGNQVLYGDGSLEVLAGGTGADTLYGGNGDDTLIGGTGNTVMYGGTGTDSIIMTQGATATFNPSDSAGAELIQLPTGMTLSDFTVFQGTGGELVLQSASGDTSLVINGYDGSSGKLWFIADSAGDVQSLASWVDSQQQTASGYEQEIDQLREEFAASLPGVLNQVGEQGGTIQYPEGWFVASPTDQYVFNGVSTQNVTVQGGALTLGDSEDEQTTYTSLQTGTTTYTVTTPVYGEVTTPGSQSFIADSSLTSTELQNMENEVGGGYGNGTDGISIVPTTNSSGEPGYEVTVLPTTETVQTGTTTTVETVPEYTYYSQWTQSLTDYNITGDGGNDVIETGPYIYNQSGDDVGPYFVGTVNTGNGNVSVDLGGNNGPETYLGHPVYNSGDVPLGAFIQAGSGNDTIGGTGGADVIAAGTGFDYIGAGLGSTVYVPLEGASTEDIYIPGPYYGGGPLPASTVVLPSGIAPQALTYQLITDVPSVYALAPQGSTCDELQITYGDSSILIPFNSNPGYLYNNSDPQKVTVDGVVDENDDGIESFQFADGTTLTRDQILAMAGPAISITNFNPTVTALNPTVTADATISGTSLFGGSDSSGSSITWYQISDSGAGGAYFTLNGVEQTPGQSFYVSNEQLPELSYVAGTGGSTDAIQVSAFDGVVWGNTTSFNIAPTGSLYQATGADEEVTGGSSGPDTLIGGYGGDTLIGSSGKDTFEYNPGGGAEVIAETAPTSATNANVLDLGSGITPSSLTLSLAGGPSLVLSTGGNGDSVTIEGFDPLSPLQSFPIQSFGFSDGSGLTLLQLLADGAVTGTSGSIANADGSTTTYDFTPSDQEVYYAQTINSAGQVTASFSLDADGSSVSRAYDGQGREVTYDATYADGSTSDTTVSYNSDGSWSETDVSTPVGGGAGTTTVYQYNAQGQQLAVDNTYSDGSTDDWSYSYNADGTSSATEVSTPAGGGATTTVYGYDSSGDTVSKQVTNPDGSSVAYTYDSQGRELTIDVVNADGSTDDATRSYNGDGSWSETDVSTPTGGGAATTTVYQYTAQGSVVNENSYTPASDGSYTDTWSMANGSQGTYWWNASTSTYEETWYDSNGSSWTDEYQYASGGSPGSSGYSFLETYTGSDGSQGSRQYDASTGAITLSWDSPSTGQLSGTTTDSGFIGLQNEGELGNTQQDLTFFNPNVSSSFSAFLAAH